MQVRGQYSNWGRSFNGYTVPFFDAYAKKNASRGWAYGCGHKAFGTLTGEWLNYSNRGDSVNDRIMIDSITKLGDYTIIPLSICAVTNHHEPFYNMIREQHVLLLSQLVMVNEATWSIIYKNKYYHGGTCKTLHPLEFIVRPILTAYIIYNKRWKEKPKRGYR